MKRFLTTLALIFVTLISMAQVQVSYEEKLITHTDSVAIIETRDTTWRDGKGFHYGTHDVVIGYEYYEVIDAKVGEFEIYPTIVTTELNLRGFMVEGSTFLIYDLRGRLLYTHENIGVGTFTIPRLPAGCYILKIGDYSNKIIFE